LLPDGHPLEVSSNSVDLSSVNGDLAALFQERLFGIVKTRESISVAVVGELYESSDRPGNIPAELTVIVPSGDPSKVLR
jgi:hypothetical protein